MNKAKGRSLFAVLAMLAAVLLAALVCTGIPKREAANAADVAAGEIEISGNKLKTPALTLNGDTTYTATVTDWDDLVVAINYAGEVTTLNQSGYNVTKIEVSAEVDGITFDFTDKTINADDSTLTPYEFMYNFGEKGADADHLYINSARTVTIDLSGKSLTVNTANALCAVAVYGNSDVTIQNGTLKGSSGGAFVVLGATTTSDNTTLGGRLALNNVKVDFTTTATNNFNSVIYSNPNAQSKNTVSLSNVKFETTATPVTKNSNTTYEYATAQDIVNATANGGTATLDKDYTGSITIPAGKTVTLDLNGKTLENTSGDAIANKGGTLTIQGNGRVIASRYAVYNSVLREGTTGSYTYSPATLIINGGTFRGTQAVRANTSYVAPNEEVLNKVTINGGTFIGAGATSVDVLYAAGEFTVANCTVTVDTDAQYSVITYLNVPSSPHTKLTVNDNVTFGAADIKGTSKTRVLKTASRFSSVNFAGANIKAYGDFANDSINASLNIAIEGGTYYGVLMQSGATPFVISGGTFAAEDVLGWFSSSWLKEGYTLSASNDGYQVIEGNEGILTKSTVAVIGTTAYTSLQEAISAAQEGKAVQMVVSSVENITFGKNITLDFGPHDYSGSITAQNAATLTVESSGNISITAFTGDGNLALKGGTSKTAIPASWLADGYTTDVDSKKVYTVIEGTSYIGMIKNGEEDVTYKFNDLFSAQYAYEEKDVVVLLSDFSGSINRITSAMEIDLNDKTWTLTGIMQVGATADKTFTVLIKDGTMKLADKSYGIQLIYSDTLQLENVTVNYTHEGGSAVYMCGTQSTGNIASSCGNLTLINSKIYATGANSCGVALYGTNAKNDYSGTLKAENSVIEGCMYGIATYGAGYNTVIDLTNTNVTATATTECTAIYNPGKDSKITISGGTITGGTGIEVRSGTVSIDGATIIANGDYGDPVPNGSGTTLKGVALGVSQHTTNMPISVTVENSTVIAKGKDGLAFIEVDTVTGDNTNPSEGVLVALKSGNFSGGVKAENITGFVQGGTYTDKNVTSYLAANLTLNESGSVVPSSETEETYVAAAVTASGTNYYTSLAEAITAAAEAGGGTVTLVADVELSSAISVSPAATITLDLNGYTIDGTKLGSSSAPIKVGSTTDTDKTGSFTIRDGSANKAGVISGNAYGVLVNNGGTLIVESGTIKGTQGIQGATGTTVTINGGTITGTKYGVYVSGATLTLNGGAISSTGGEFDYAVYVNGSSLSVPKDSTVVASTENSYGLRVSGAGDVNVAGGTFTGKDAVSVVSNAEVTVTGGTFNGSYGFTVSGASLTLEGVALNNAVGVYGRDSKITLTDCTIAKASYGAYVTGSSTLNISGGSVYGSTAGVTAKNSSTVSITNGTQITSDGDGVALSLAASIAANGSTTYYATLQEAVNAAAEGATVTLVENVELSEALTLATKGITLDFAGKDITMTAGSITVSAEGVTLTNSQANARTQSTLEGSVIVTGTNATIENLSIRAEAAAVSVTLGGSATIRNCYITTNGGSGVSVNGISGGASATISGTTIETNNAYSPAVSTMYGGIVTIGDNTTVTNKAETGTALSSVQSSTLTVNGSNVSVTAENAVSLDGSSAELATGSYNGTVAASRVTGFIGAGASFTQPVDSEYLAANTSLTVDKYGNYTVTSTAGAASVVRDGTAYLFSTFAEAMTFAQDGDTVILEQGITTKAEIHIEKSITLDLNGYSISTTDPSTDGSLNFAIRVKGDVEAVITSSKEGGKVHGISVQDDAAATIRNITISAAVNGATTKGGLRALQAASATLTLDGVTVTDAFTNAIDQRCKDTLTGSDIALVYAFFQQSDVTLRNSTIDVSYAGTLPTLTSSGKQMQLQAVQAEGGSNLTVENSTVRTSGTTDGATFGINFFGAMSSNDAIAADAASYSKLTVVNSTVESGAAISTYGALHGTDITIEDSTITASDIGIYHPGYGNLTIKGKTTVEGLTGIEMRAGNLTIADADVTVTATDAFSEDANGSGSTVKGAAVAVSQHSTQLPVRVALSAGTYIASGEGGKSFYETDLQGEPLSEGVELSLSGGVYKNEVVSKNVTAFITGGQYTVEPNESLVNDAFEAEKNPSTGYFEMVSTKPDDLAALLTAQENAKTEVRNYAVSNGMSWAYVTQLAGDASSELNEAAVALTEAYAAIGDTTSELLAARALSAAYNKVDALVAAFSQLKEDKIAELETAAQVDAQVDGDIAVTLPTATYYAVRSAATEAELASYVANAMKEIEQLKVQLKSITSQADQLNALAAALAEIDSGLFGSAGADGATGTEDDVAGAVTDLKAAIAAAQKAIVNGTEGETDAASLKSISDYLANTINEALKTIDNNVDSLVSTLGDVKTAVETMAKTLDMTDDNGLLATVKSVIVAAQGAIMGVTQENVNGTSVAAAVTAINTATKEAVEKLQTALLNDGEGEKGYLVTMNEVINAIKGMMTNDQGNKLDEILTKIDTAKDAIIGTTEDASGAATLNGLLAAVDTVNSTVNTAMAEIRNSLGNINTKLDTYNTALGELATYLGKDNTTTTLMARIEAALEASNKALLGTDINDIADAVSKVNSVTKDAVAALQTALLNDGTDGEKGYLVTMNEVLTKLDTALATLQTTASGNEKKLTSLASEVNNIKGTVGAIQNAVGSLNDVPAALTSLQSSVSGVNSIVSSISNLLNEWTEDIGLIAGLKTSLDAANAGIDALTGVLLDTTKAKLSETIANAIAKLDTIRSDIAQVSSEVEAVYGEVTGVSDDLGSLATYEQLTAAIGTLADAIAQVKSDINEVSNSVGAAEAVEEAKTDAVDDIRAWLDDYIDQLLGESAQAGIVVSRMAYTPETTEGEVYAKLLRSFSEDNANLVLRYYNEALAAIDAATTVSDVTTAVATFRAQVASVEASAQNTPSLTGVYVMLGIVLFLIVAAACVAAVVMGRRRAAAAAAVAEVPADDAGEEAAPEAAEEAPEVAEESAETAEDADAAPVEMSAEQEIDPDKEQVVIAANVRSFSEAYMDLSDEQRDLFAKVRDYALAKERAVEVKQSGGVCIKRDGKQIVKLTVRRDMPVALFLLENEMLKSFRRNAKSEAKLKIRATELVIRDEEDLETAFTMVDLSIDQIEKDIEAAKERRREARRQRRLQRQAEEAAAAEAVAGDAGEDAAEAAEDAAEAPVEVNEDVTAEAPVEDVPAEEPEAAQEAPAEANEDVTAEDAGEAPVEDVTAEDAGEALVEESEE